MVAKSKDITKPKSISGVTDDESGTGIYWLNDADGTQERMFVPDITLARARQLADQLDSVSSGELDAFRWVPRSERTFIWMAQTECGGPCDKHLDCVNPACRCYDGICAAKRP